MNFKIRFIFSFLLPLFFFFGNAQVANFTFTPPSGGCNNNVVNFSGTSSNSTVATSFTFNGGALPAGWEASPYTINATFCPGKNTPDNSSYFWATNLATTGPNTGLRYVQTNAINVALGGSISFLLRYAADEAPSAGCEDPEQPNEEVWLQYSINGGTNWITIYDQWDTNGSFSLPWYNWYAVNLPIPAAAQTAATLFRWYQPSNDGAGFDNWGLEDVNITSTSPISVTSYAWDFGDATTANTENVTKTYPVPAAGTSTTYNVTLTAVFSDASTDSETKPYTVNSSAAAPTAAAAQSFCTGATVANLVASGVNLRWYIVPSGGVALAPSSSISTGTYYVSQTTANGCESSRTAVSVTVGGSGGITVITRPVTVQLDASGNASVTAAQVDNGSTAVCGIASITVSPNTFTCANVGPNTVTLTVTDANGNTGTGTAIVTVQDVTAPSITCAADVTTNTTSGCIALVPNVPPTIVDACATTVTVNGLTQNSSNVLEQTLDCGVNAFSPKSYRVYDLFALGINSDIQINNIRAVAVNGATIQAKIYSYTGSLSGSTLDMTTATLIATSNSVTGGGTLQTLTMSAHTIAGASKFIIEITNLSTAIRFGVGYNQSGTDSRESYFSRQGCINVPTKLSVFGLQVNKLICEVNAQTAGAQNLITFSGVPLNFEYPVGTTTTTYTVTDASGNASSCNRLITVQDNTPPTVITQNITVQLDASGNATITAAQINNGSTDNCGIATITVSPSTFTCANVGANTVTLTVTDVNGNVSTGTAVVTVQDTILPTAVSQNITVQLNASGTATITGAQINNGSTDNCGIATITVSPNTFNCTNLGNNTVTLTVTDVNGNVSTATATVLVRDQINPVVITQNITLALGPNGQVTLNPSLINNGSYDNCGFTLTATPNTFGPANVGVNTVILVATDSSGNVSFATAIVTIIDNTPPTVITQNVTVQLNAAGTATVTAAQVNNGSTDNTFIASMSVAPSSFTCANIGANTVTLTVTDVHGNSATNTAIVTVVDLILPTITAPANVTVNTNSGCTATGVVLGTAITADNCSVASVTNNAPSVFPLGITTVTWTVTDGSGNIRTATQTVRVNDIINPTITAPANVVVSASNSCVAVNVNLGTPVRADNCSVASVTNNGLTTYPLGVTTVTWTVTDGSGNTATATQTVTVNDTTLPTIVAPAALTVSSSATCGVTGLALGTPVADDNCTVASVTNNAPTTFPLGSTTVTWTVTDGSGNIRTATQIVTVVDTTLPTITPPANVTVNTNSGCTATGVVIGTATTADNCSVASVTNNAPSVFPLGVTTVTWTVTDGSGNIRTATQIVRVNDNVNPTITAPANVTVASNNNCVAVNVNLGTPVRADNCSVASVTNNGLSTYPLGVTTVTWTVTDGSGNTATATQTVTVNDTTLPTIVAPAALTVSSSATCGVTGLALGTPVANDNCSVASVTNNAPTTFPLGSTTVTWTVTDGSGNIRTATQVVTVVDTTLPTITPPANVTVNTNSGCTATGVVIGTATTADNCSVASVTNNAPSVFPLGVTTVTWTVTDGSGNIRTATQIVRVNDNVNPTITAPANVTVASNNNCVAVNVNLGTPVRADNCSVASVTNNGLSSYPIGVTTVTWTVTDGSGNTATSTQTVTVTDAVMPTIVAPAAISVNANSNSCTATNVVLGVPVAGDNCSVASVTNNAPVAFPLGITTVIWTVTDGSGNTTTATQLVTVRDMAAPVVVTQNISAFLNAAGQVSITAAQVNNGSSDNCGIASIVVSPSTFNCSKLGANVVTLIVTDVNGNVASGTAIVTVVDNIAPIAVTQNITVILNPNGQISITAAMINNGSTDNCSVASVSLNKTTFDCSNLGTNTVLFTVTDGSGNTTVVPVQVTVTKRFGDTDNVCGTVNINVSQVITPNGDGVNDTWMISNIESYPKNTVKVFNRWGSEVFFANGYRNDWNGYYKNSSQSLPDGSSYYYQIDLDGDGTIEKDGWIYISRL